MKGFTGKINISQFPFPAIFLRCMKNFLRDFNLKKFLMHLIPGLRAKLYYTEQYNRGCAPGDHKRVNLSGVFSGPYVKTCTSQFHCPETG